MPFFQVNDFWQVCTKWYELVKTGFVSLISDFDESEISVNFFSIENPIEITNFWNWNWNTVFDQKLLSK